MISLPITKPEQMLSSAWYISIFLYTPWRLTLHFSTLFHEGKHVSVSTAFVFRYIVSLNAYTVLVETSSHLTINKEEGKCLGKRSSTLAPLV